jgi:uncharacterized membrane protein YphA (DoxX/SURF4 family)
MTIGRPNQISLLQWLASIILTAVFITAALPKITDVASFALSIDQYQLFPSVGVTLLALSLPWLELVVGLGLLVPQVQKSSRRLCATLLSLFIAVHISALARGIEVQCACFGEESSGSSVDEALVRNVGLLVLAIAILYWEQMHRKQTKRQLMAARPEK